MPQADEAAHQSLEAFPAEAAAIRGLPYRLHTSGNSYDSLLIVQGAYFTLWK